MISEKLQPIFNGDYPGINIFISEVLRPVLGNDIEMKNQNLADDELYKTRAQNAGIRRLDYVADIFDKNYSCDRISLFDVTVDNRVQIERSRVNIQALIRSIVQSYSHILIAFHYEDVVDEPWRFSYAYKQGSLVNTTSARRFTYVFGKGYRGRTAADRFEVLANSQHRDDDFIKAFSVEALSDDFFNGYRKIYADFVERITGCRYEKVGGKWEEQVKHEPDSQFESTFEGDKKLVRDYIKKMFGRIVFLYFLQRKKWLGGNLNYMSELWANSTKKDNFLDGVLEPLFFEVLNTEKDKRSEEAFALPNCEDIPYLNGGLFAQEEIDERTCVFPADYFQNLFDFLDSYNFTIDENDLEDSEVGIDPEMLGRIFESLLEDNKDKGAFYTPKEIVDYMCREALIVYLNNDLPERAHSLIRDFVETQDAHSLDEKQKVFLRKKLQSVKICDPAIGSGAFPMGLINLLSKIFVAMKPDTDTSKMKRYILENNIYGVDFDRGAVDIARLRFWLSMIVDEKEPQPLPNLHFKIMQGNSLLEGPQGVDLSDLVVTKVHNSIFDSEDYDRSSLASELKIYYNTSDHQERDKILERIKKNIRRQIFEKRVTLPEDIDPSANDQFFLWHTWFSDVFAQGGFDIVIGNPPYKILTKNNTDITELTVYNTIYNSIKKSNSKNLYTLFIELGITRLCRDKGVLSFIVPEGLFQTRSYGDCVAIMKNNGSTLQTVTFTDYVFENAVTGSLIFLYIKSIDGIHTKKFHFDSGYILKEKEEIENKIIKKVKENTVPLSKVAVLFKGMIVSERKNSVFSDRKNLPNKFLLGKNIKKWSIVSNLWTDYNELKIIGGTKSLDKHNHVPRILIRRTGDVLCCSYLQNAAITESTLYSCWSIDEDVNNLFLYALLNSTLLNYYNKECNITNQQGFPQILMTDLENLPIKLTKNQQPFNQLINHIINLKGQDIDCDVTDIENRIDKMVYHLYGLTYDEVLIVDPDTPIRREDYESFKIDDNAKSE